jgi:tetratricopeptide (TPR) repeat protein
VRSRVLAKLYDVAEDGDAADILVGLGFTAIAIARARARAMKQAKADAKRRIVIAYHDSNIDPLVPGEKPPKVPRPVAAVAKKPSPPKKIASIDSSPTAWRLRAAKYGDVAAAAQVAIKAIEAGDKPAAKIALAALAKVLKRPMKGSYDAQLSPIGGLYFVAQRLGDAAKMKQAKKMFERTVKSAQARFRDDKPYAEHVEARAKHLFERHQRGIKNGEYWFLGADEIPLEVWIPLLDGMRARLDRDVACCRAALKRLDAAVAPALKQRGMRERLLKIGGEYAMLQGFCGNAAKVREILRRFRGKYDGPKPKQSFAALFDAGDRKAAATVASRELKKRLDEVTGKAGVIAAMNAHHSLLQLDDIFQAQLAAGDRDGVARGLDAVEKALARKAGRNAEARAWALKTVADLEFRIGRPDRARAANEIAEKLAAKARGAEIRSMSWRGVAEVYARLGEWDEAQAAIAKIPSRHDKRGATIVMLIHRGDMDAVSREIAKMSGNEAKRDACEFVATVLEERSSSSQ